MAQFKEYTYIGGGKIILNEDYIIKKELIIAEDGSEQIKLLINGIDKTQSILVKESEVDVYI